MNAWVLLAIAIGFEITGTLLLKMSDGFSNWLYGTASIVSYGFCFTFLAIVLKSVPVGVAYAIWSGVGIVGVSIASYFMFKQSLSPAQGLFMLLIFIGAIGLNLTTKSVS